MSSILDMSIINALSRLESYLDTSYCYIHNKAANEFLVTHLAK